MSMGLPSKLCQTALKLAAMWATTADLECKYAHSPFPKHAPNVHQILNVEGAYLCAMVGKWDQAEDEGEIEDGIYSQEVPEE